MSESLETLARIHYGKTPNDVLSIDGKVPIVGTGGVYGFANRAMFERGIVVARKGSLGKPHLFKTPFWPVDTTYAVIPCNDVDIDWLYYCLLNFDLTKLNEATGVPSINRNWLAKTAFNNPGATRQTKIAAILTATDSTIEKTEALIAKYQQIKAGLMHDLFTRGMLPNGQLRPPRSQAPELYQETAIGWIPREWALMKIGEVFDIQLGKMLNQDAKTGKSSFPYVGNRSVQWNKVDVGALEEMDFSPAEREKFSLVNDDLLVCEGGDVGRTAIWESPIENCYYQKAIHRLRPKGNHVKPRFMLRFMWYAKTTGHFDNYTSQTSIAHLTQEKLAAVPMAVPNIDEQNLLIVRFDGLDSILEREKELVANLRQQKLGLMQDLLTGKVPVQVDEAEAAHA